MKVSAWLLLPAAFIGVGVGLSVWLSVAITGHNFTRELSLESRSAERVGATPIPQSPIVITIKPTPKTCLQIESAVVEENDITAYVRNACSADNPYSEIRWRALSPNGTIVRSGWTNWGAGEFEAGQSMEKRFHDYKPDRRAAEIQLYIREPYSR